MVFKITRHRLRNNVFILFTILSILFLVLVSPIALNVVDAFSFRYAESIEHYRTDYSDGYGELIIEFNVDNYNEERYYWAISCHFTSSGAVEIVGIKQLNYTVDIGGILVGENTYDWDPPNEQFLLEPVTVVRLTKNDIISLTGIVEVQYISNSINQTETHNFVLRIIVPMGSQDVFNLQILSNFVFFFWILAFPVFPILLNYFIKPSFGVPLDEEVIKKQKKYFDFIRKTKEKQS